MARRRFGSELSTVSASEAESSQFDDAETFHSTAMNRIRVRGGRQVVKPPPTRVVTPSEPSDGEEDMDIEEEADEEAVDDGDEGDDDGGEEEMDEDGDEGEEGDGEEEEEELMEEEEEEPEEEDGEREEEDMDMDEPTPEPSAHKPTPRLKIRLKLGSRHSSVADSGAAAESEEQSPLSEEELVVPSGKRLTARQAVLKGGADSAHVTLDDIDEAAGGTARKKRQLTEQELALRREETARKRKNLSEKKLQDEKADTIRRLLKRQSRAKRQAAEQEEREQDEDGADAVEAPPPAPTMYRWTSHANGRITFAVPENLLPQMTSPPSQTPLPSYPPPLPKCSVSGCDALRKYRLSSDMGRGACGLEHLRTLQAVQQAA